MTIKNFKTIPSTELKPGDILVFGALENIYKKLDGIVLTDPINHSNSITCCFMYLHCGNVYRVTCFKTQEYHILC